MMFDQSLYLDIPAQLAGQLLPSKMEQDQDSLFLIAYLVPHLNNSTWTKAEMRCNE